MNRNRGFRFLLLLTLCAPAMAGATLGEAESTVQDDGVRTRAAVQVTRGAAFSIHELSGERAAVREYVAPGGIVYGVAWDGPRMPDLRQLLGSYFDKFSQSPHRLQAGRSVLIVTEPDLVVESFGHMRALRGRAYLPGAIPAGVSIDSIR